MSAASLVTAAATTLASAAAVSAATPTPAAAAAPTAIFAGTSFVHGQVAAVVLLLVQRRDCLASRIVIGHFHESKTLAPPGVPVGDDLGTPDLAELGEQFFQAGVRDVVTQIPDVQLHSHCQTPRKLAPRVYFPGRLERDQKWWPTRWRGEKAVGRSRKNEGYSARRQTNHS